MRVGGSPSLRQLETAAEDANSHVLDAAATREWLLSCFKAEGMALPSPGARETALAMEHDMAEEEAPVRTRRPFPTVSELQPCEDGVNARVYASRE